jgi:hypothetical protein
MRIYVSIYVSVSTPNKMLIFKHYIEGKMSCKVDPLPHHCELCGNKEFKRVYGVFTGIIVIFTKVLTIYHSKIHPILYSPLSSSSSHSWNSFI